MTQRNGRTGDGWGTRSGHIQPGRLNTRPHLAPAGCRALCLAKFRRRLSNGSRKLTPKGQISAAVDTDRVGEPLTRH
jgi:hypothetical protein